MKPLSASAGHSLAIGESLCKEQDALSPLGQRFARAHGIPAHSTLDHDDA